MEKSKNIGKMKDYLVIGLGKFGRSVATQLYEMGNEVLAIDKNPQNVSEVEGKVSTAVTADATSYEVLHSLGAQNFDCAVVCVGDSIESSLLIAQACKELEVNFIIAKAKSEQHAKILYALGVDTVILPEKFAGKKLANLLTKSGINELVDLSTDFKMFEMPVPEQWIDKNIEDLKIDRKYRLSIVFVKREDEVLLSKSRIKFQEGDVLVLAGESSKINSLASTIQNHDNINNALNSVFGDE